MEFHKMHGAGNDFVLIDARTQDCTITPQWATRIADRHTGVGCDQILVLRPADELTAVARYEIWNSDGSPAGQCGNGARCIALFLWQSGLFGESFEVESPAGLIAMHHCSDGEFELAMGIPAFDPDEVPVSLSPGTAGYELASPWGPLKFGCVSMGNPHVVSLVDDIADPQIPQMGEFLRNHEVFPDRVNAGFAQLTSRNRILLRVIERGAGETLACGSGACAAVAVLLNSGHLDEQVEVVLPGGTLVIKWRGAGEPLYMKGPATHVFKGTMND